MISGKMLRGRIIAVSALCLDRAFDELLLTSDREERRTQEGGKGADDVDRWRHLQRHVFHVEWCYIHSGCLQFSFRLGVEKSEWTERH